MVSYSFVALVSLAAIALYFYMGLQVGMARSRYDVKAPATSGHPEFERYFRVHMNTLEWLVIFLPCLWIAAVFTTDWGPIAASAVTVLGVIWIIGRYIYMKAYVKDPATRSRGFAIQALATLLLFVIDLAAAVINIVTQ